jgi:TolB-like protein/tetratricopeptide (TPR) repeat protein
LPDVFISYTHDDRPIARRFADAFAAQGFSVWWDVTLNPGEAFDEVTEKALNEAKAVVVLWSKKSVSSRWVRAEATQAARDGTLAPVMIESCQRPIMFELTHTADLSHWSGDQNDPAWQSYLAAVRRLVEKSERVSSTHPAPSSSTSRAPRVSAVSLGILAAAVLIVGGGILWALTTMRGEQVAAPNPTPPNPPTTNALRTSVAVMPFTNLTGDASKDYLGDGMAEELINALAKVPGLTVPSRTSSFAYKGRNTNLKQIAADLGVGTVLEGSVRSAGTTIRVTAQLIDAQTDRHLWAATYDHNFTDLFKLQDDLAREVVIAFKKTLGADLPEFESQAPPTKDVEAYRLYLEALAVMNRNADPSLRLAIGLLEKAVARDPEFAEAYLAMASARGLVGEPLAAVERDARRAIALDGRLTNRAQTLFANIEAKRSNWLAAEAIYAALPPDSPEPDFHINHIISVLWPTGQSRRVREEYIEAVRLAPARGATVLQLGMVSSALGRDAEAIKYANEAVALGVDASSRRSLQLYGDIASRAGRYDEAADFMTRALPDRIREDGGGDVVKLVYAALADRTKKKAALAALETLRPKLTREDWVVKVWAMSWYTQLGEIGDAYRLADELRLEFSEQNPTNAWSWLWSPDLQAFRRDPRFDGLTTRLGLKAFWNKHGPPDDCELTGGKVSCR